MTSDPVGKPSVVARDQLIGRPEDGRSAQAEKTDIGPVRMEPGDQYVRLRPTLAGVRRAL
jgi:hypothetical protein